MWLIWCASCGHFDPAARSKSCLCDRSRSLGLSGTKNRGRRARSKRFADGDQEILIIDDATGEPLVLVDDTDDREITLPPGVEVEDVGRLVGTAVTRALGFERR